MKIEILHADITTLKVDAIINTANGSLTGGGGVDGAIHRAAGKELRDYCFTLKGCKTGYAKITPGFKLQAKYVIHTVGPGWNNGTENEELLLKMCYENCLRWRKKTILNQWHFLVSVQELIVFRLKKQR